MDDALTAAGAPAKTLRAGEVTYVLGPAAMVIVLHAFDGLDAQSVTLRPVPAEIERALVSPQAILLFAGDSSGLRRLGPVRLGITRREPGATLGQLGPMTEATLRFEEPLPYAVLDRIRPTPPEPLPSLDWLGHLPADAIAAMREFVAGWFADVPPGDLPITPDRPVPPALHAFYEVAAGRKVVHQGQNQIYPADELEELPDGRLQFGAENQGVWDLSIDADHPDPTVQYDGDVTGPENEPLGGFLLQFLLSEAAIAGPYGGWANLNDDQLWALIGRMRVVPLRPLRTPADPTHLYVGPGVAAMTYRWDDGWECWIGSRWRSALRPFRDGPWESFSA